MERFSSNAVRDSLKGSGKRSGYNGNYNYDTTGSRSGSATPTRKNIKSVRFGDANKNPSQFEASKGSRSTSTTDQLSPFKIWRKVKDGYYNMTARKVSASHAASEFDSRVVQEIYKSMSVTS